MTTRYANVELDVKVIINDEEAITRVTGPEGDEWRSRFYDLYTEEDVIEHFAYNAIINNVDRANRLDGWADLADDAVTMFVDLNSAWVNVAKVLA